MNGLTKRTRFNFAAMDSILFDTDFFNCAHGTPVIGILDPAYKAAAEASLAMGRQRIEEVAAARQRLVVEVRAQNKKVNR